MSNITTVTLTNGIPIAGSGNVSTIDNLIAVGLPISAGLPSGANTIGAISSIGANVVIATGNNLSGAFMLQDGMSTNRALIQAFHNTDNQSIGGTSYGIFTGGVAQLVNISGNLDRQRGTGTDNTPATGISTGIQTTAMFFKTFSNNSTAISAGANTVYPKTVSGNVGNVPWTITNGSVLTIGPGTANQENIIVTGANTISFTANFAYAHPTNTVIYGFTYNQGRDAAGENDGASGSGTSIAAGYEYNGGDPSGGNFDRERSINAKGYSSFTISSGGTQGSNSIVVSTTPTGLQPGMKVLLTNNANLVAGIVESINVDLSYIPGSTTVPLSSNIVQSTTYTLIAFDSFAALGSQLNGFLPFGVGIEEEAIYDPVSGKYFIGRTATSDAMGANNIPAEGVALWNGTTFDRLKGNTAVGALTASVSLGTDVVVVPTVNSTVAYTAGWVIGGIMTFSNVLSSTNSGMIESMTLTFKNSLQTGQYNVAIFNASPTGTFTDHGAPAIANTDSALLEGIYSLSAPWSSLGTHTTYNLDGIGKQIIGSTSNTLYAVVIAVNGSTNNPTTTSDMALRISTIW